MRTKKKEDSIYVKDLDEMDNYYLNIFKKYLDGTDAYLQDSVEAIITEVLTRAKKEIIDELKKSSIYQTTVCTKDTRPATPSITDLPVYDKSINKIIWWNGNTWIDAMGNNV